MSKKAALYESAERLYIDGQCTFEEIAAQLGISEKTARLWADEGNWREKRSKYLQQKEALHEKLYHFTDTLMDNVMRDLKSDNPVDPGRMYALGRLINNLTKVRQYEQDVAKESGEHNARRGGLNDEVIKQIEEQLGIL